MSFVAAMPDDYFAVGCTSEPRWDDCSERDEQVIN
jgi:hypothetical protein